MSQKEQWPELVGKTGEEAKAAILKERPELRVQILDEGSMVTMDYCTDRVRIFVNPSTKRVTQAPGTG